MAVGAIKNGAFDFIEKPFDEARLLASIRDSTERAGQSESTLGGVEARRRHSLPRQILLQCVEHCPFVVYQRNTDLISHAPSVASKDAKNAVRLESRAARSRGFAKHPESKNSARGLLRQGTAVLFPAYCIDRVQVKPVWSADQERETLPVTSDEKGALSIARRRER